MMDDDIPELTAEQLASALPARVRKRLMLGQLESGADVAALRRFVGLSQSEFARAMGISVRTLRNWEQGRRHPRGPAIAVLRIAARHPRIFRENLDEAAEVRKKGRSKVLRPITSDVLRQRPEQEIDAEYVRAFTGVEEDPLGRDFEGGEEEGVWPPE